VQVITLDFETFYDRTFSLSKMTTEEYIRDELFEVIGVGVKVNDGETQWFSGTVKKTSEFLDQFDWANSIAVAHNAMFDMAILNWHFDIRPKMIADTLSILRAVDGPDAGNSLAKAAERYGLGKKGDEVINALGKGRLDFTPDELERYGEYCKNDVELTYQLFQRVAPLVPKLEAKLIDLTIRMFSEPVLELDKCVLEDHLVSVRQKKEKLMAAVEADKSVLMSNPQLAALLQQMKVVPPTKISPTTGKTTWAFGKTDEGFKALLDHPNPKVQAIVAARMGVKSTLEETRTERFIGIADRGTLPVPLRYYAAHCLTGDAEVLTRTGWVSLEHWKGGDIVQWSPDGVLKFAAATANRFEVDEDLVVANARYHKAAYTKGHTVPGFSGRGVFKTLRAGDLLTKRIEIPLCGSLGGSEDISELDVRLAAMVQADGSIRDDKQDRAVRFGFRKPRKVARCKQLLREAGIEYSTTVEPNGTTRIRVGRLEWHPLVKLLSGSNKNFLPTLLDAPFAAKLAFMEEIAFWDGDVEPHSRGYTYTSTNEHNARFIQTMAHLTGMSAFVSEREREGWSKAYRVYVRRGGATRSEPRHYSTKRHFGFVYCPTTETGYFLMRQNGHITVTGNTGRWGGDDKVNLQNLPRKSPLKKAMLAPDGYTFIDCDSSQIEARTLAWLAGQDDLVEAFDKGEDVYKIMASRIYGVSVDEVTDTQRFVGKTTILGCLAEGTLVLTDRGWVAIEAVTTDDRLWDGEEWVCHQGLVKKGIKETLSLCGLWLTPDHKVLCGTQWLEAQSVAQDSATLSLALDTGAVTWLSPGTSKASEGALLHSSSSVTADVLSTPWTEITSRISRAHAAPPAVGAKGTVNVIGSTLPHFLTNSTEYAFLTGFRPQSAVATSPVIGSTPTTEVEASLYVSSGATTAQRSSNTSRPCPDGTTPSSTWIGRITAVGMNPATYGSSPVQITTRTGERSASYRRSSMTYDIAYAGPRNRYTVATDAGPIIVHNCGYGMGADKFQMQLKAFGVELPLTECRHIISTYRQTYSAIPQLWFSAGRALTALQSQRTSQLGREGVLAVDLLGIKLPNGMYIRYPNLREDKDGQLIYDTKRGRATIPTRIYGGKVIENVCQALARIVIGEQLLMVARRYRVVMTVHDAVGCIAPVEEAAEARAFVEQCMRMRPKWASGLPLNCESKIGASYGG
jgi:DNA polymerase I-like protein with 3'-5' exonuclease and polymerase domains